MNAEPTDAFEGLLAQAALHYTGAPSEALRLADEALAGLGDAPEPQRLVQGLVVRGNALSYHGRYPESLATLQQALDALPPEPRRLRVRVLRAFALAYHEMGALDAALEWAMQAGEVARADGDPRLLAETLLSLGVALSSNGDDEGGMRHWEEALAICLSLGDQRATMPLLNNLGIACKKMGRHTEALGHIEQALAVAAELKDSGAAAVISSNLGEPLWRLGRIAQARSAMAQAVELNTRSGYIAAQTHSRILLGELLFSEGETTLAQAELEQALALAREHGSRSHAARGHKALAELHKAAGRFEQALQHHEAYHAQEQERFNEDSHRKLRALQVQFDLARAQQEAQRARLESAELAAQTRTDALTGLSNRRHLDERLAQEFARARRQGHALALAMADIDDFKHINDRYGHTAGDAVLRVVAALLRQHCRAIDIAARYGGEEFCVVFLEAESSFAERACEAMRVAVIQHDWSTLQPGLRVTLSLGVAELGTPDTPSALLAAADAQLYAAKHAGKNRVSRQG